MPLQKFTKRIFGRALARKVSVGRYSVDTPNNPRGGFADGMSERSEGIPDSEGIELTRTAGSKAKLPPRRWRVRARGANPRSGFSVGL